MNGTHWVCFIAKENKPLYSDSFGGGPDFYPIN